MGVANERSIAWGISQKLSEAGAGTTLFLRASPKYVKANSAPASESF